MSTELDAWLAEHLFGLTPDHEPGEKYFWGTFNGRPEPHRLTELTYSTTGDGMLLVMEAMRERGLMVEIISHTVTFPQYNWCALFFDADHALDGDRGGPQYNESAPLAVAKAAKMALEASEPANPAEGE